MKAPAILALVILLAAASLPSLSAADTPAPTALPVQTIQQKLDAQSLTLIYDHAPLREIFAGFSTASGIPLHVEWPALYDAGIAPTTRAKLFLEKTPARQALATLLSRLDTPATLAVYDTGDQLIISTLKDLRSRYQSVQAYDISFALQDTDPQSQQAYQIESQLIGALINTVAPDTWRDNGGFIGTAQIVNGQLLVNQSFDLLPKVDETIAALRQQMQKSTRIYDVKDLAPARDRAKTEDLIAALESACSPDAGETTGKGGTIAPFDGKLLITATPATHDQIQSTLALLRKK